MAELNLKGLKKIKVTTHDGNQILIKGFEEKDHFDVEAVTPEYFSENYGDGVSIQGLHYAMDKGHVDYFKLGIGRNRLIVMTEKTKTYNPNHSEKWDRKEVIKKEKVNTKPKKKGNSSVMET